MAKVFVEGDLDALDQIQTALRSAGLDSVDVEFVSRSRSVTRTVSPPAANRTYSLNRFLSTFRPTERITIIG